MNEYEMLKDLIETYLKRIDLLTYTIVAIVIINLLLEFIRHRMSLHLAHREKLYKKQLLIEEKSIKVLEQLFQSLDSLSLFDKSESVSMLEKIKEINLYISKNKLYIPKAFQDHSSNILDYFKNVLTDYRCKNIETETKLFTLFSDEFNR